MMGAIPQPSVPAPDPQRPGGDAPDPGARRALATLDREALPAAPGVFVLYRDDHAVFIGKSALLRTTIAQLLATGATAVSPARRAAAGFLGLASAPAIASGRYRPTPEDQERITRWLQQCTVAVHACASETEAVELEARLRAAPLDAIP